MSNYIINSANLQDKHVNVHYKMFFSVGVKNRNNFLAKPKTEDKKPPSPTDTKHKSIQRQKL